MEKKIKKLIEKRNSYMGGGISCPVCRKNIQSCDSGLIYVKTKRKTELLIHKGCFKKEGGK